MYSDPSGEVLVPLLVAAILKAVVFSTIMYMATAIITGEASKQGFLKSIGFSAISAGLTFGVGEIFRTTGSIAKKLGESWTLVSKIGSHALIQGTLSLMQGGKFLSGALAGGFAAGSNELLSSALEGSKVGSFLRNDTFALANGAITGGIGSVLGGGNFWMGAGQGLMVTAFNFLEHKTGGDPLEKKNESSKQSNPVEFTVKIYDTVYEQEYLGNNSTDWINNKPDSFIFSHTANIAAGTVLGTALANAPALGSILSEAAGVFTQTEVQYKGEYALYQQKSYSGSITFNLLGKITKISNLQFKTQVKGYLVSLKQRVYYPMCKVSQHY